MILVDTGLLVALFDPADGSHARCVEVLKRLDQPLWTTVPVLTEACHMLTPESPEAERLMDFVTENGLAVWFLGDESVERAFELMRRYANVPMDLADASLVVAAETLQARRIFTLDRKDFAIYRVRRGHRQLALEIMG